MDYRVFVLTIQLLYTQVWFMHYHVFVLTIQLLHTQVWPYLCVQQLYGQNKHTIVHEPHLCVQQLNGQYKHNSCGLRVFVLTIQLLYTQVWFMHYLVFVLTIQLLYTEVSTCVYNNCMVSTNTR
jgi:hypothetical protein